MSEFVQSVEDAAAIRGWTDKNKVGVVTLKVKGTANGFFKSLVISYVGPTLNASQPGNSSPDISESSTSRNDKELCKRLSQKVYHYCQIKKGCCLNLCYLNICFEKIHK